MAEIASPRNAMIGHTTAVVATTLALVLCGLTDDASASALNRALGVPGRTPSAQPKA